MKQGTDFQCESILTFLLTDTFSEECQPALRAIKQCINMQTICISFRLYWKIMQKSRYLTYRTLIPNLQNINV